MRVQLISRPAGDRGAVAITAGLLAIPLLVITAFGLDFGNAFAQRRALSTGADSGALAIVAGKRDLIEANPSLYTTCASVLATDPSAVAAKQTALTKINDNAPFSRTLSSAEVTASLSCSGSYLVADVAVDTSVPTSLGGLVGVSSVRANRTAQAVIKVGSKSDCGLCIIGDQDHDIQNGNVEINNGNVAFNGNAGSGPNGEVNVITLGGTISIEGDRLYPSKGEMNPPPLTHQPKMEDPLAFLSMPPDLTGLTKKSNICTDGPGIYASLSPTTNPCVLSGGMYVITGGTHYSGQNQVIANGVTLYFTCKDGSGWPRECGPGEGGDQELTGQSTLDISAPTTTANKGIVGMAILADRNYDGKLSFRGNPAGGVSGTIYMKNATLDIRGNGETTTATSLIVVDDLTFSGNNATLKINYAESVNVRIPTSLARLTQ